IKMSGGVCRRRAHLPPLLRSLPPAQNQPSDSQFQMPLNAEVDIGQFMATTSKAYEFWDQHLELLG
ncbi:hypothetical protein, partial [Acidithiobacillus sp.]|uniref:hypothetical protein n=1 Tax=Acidithiobacillus sp. TaxID=1872118 RepID=UPI003D030D98